MTTNDQMRALCEAKEALVILGNDLASYGQFPDERQGLYRKIFSFLSCRELRDALTQLDAKDARIKELETASFEFWKTCMTIKKTNTLEWMEYFAERLKAFEAVFDRKDKP